MASTTIVASPLTPLNPRSGEWLCEVCGNVNYGSRTRCHMSVCGAPRGFPGPFKHGMNIGRTGPTPQPWTCPVCRNFNRATRDQCHRTGCTVVRTMNNGVVAFTCPSTEHTIQTGGALERKDGPAPPYSFTDKRPRGGGPPPAHHLMKQPPPQFVAPPPFQPPLLVAAAPPSGGYSWGLVPQWGGLPVLGRQQPMVIGGPPGSWIAPPPGFSVTQPGAFVIGGPGGVPMIASTGGDVNISAMGPGGAYPKVA